MPMRASIVALFMLAAASPGAFVTSPPALAAGATLALPPTVTIADVAHTPTGNTVRLVGVVLDGYLCPPCPAGAMCKPCMGPSAIFVGETATHAPFSPFARPADILTLATDDPGSFTRGSRYRFEFTVADARSDAVDGRLLRAQPADDAEWTDNPDMQEQPGVVPVK